MEPQNIRFGGGTTETILHPLVLVAMVLAIVFILLLPRKRIIVPILLVAFLIPLGQVLVVAGIHLMVLRIIVIFAWIRVIGQKLSPEEKLLTGSGNSIDKAFSLWAFFAGTIFMLLYMEKGAVINHLGFLLDAFGGYFLLRFLIRDDEDIRRVIKVFACIAGIMALCMLNEQWAQHNVFGLLGGHRFLSEIREGRVRSQGVFGHPLLAGAFGATLLPLFFGLWKSDKSKLTALVGIVSCTVITLTTWTSTAVLAYAAGIVALCFWPFRKKMRLIRWGIVLVLAGLHLAMKAPVWVLIARIGVIGSSSGYHRYLLIDNFLRRFGDWWLVGTKDYNNWEWDMWDLSNGYVAQGLGGGLVTFICFVAIIAVCFGRIGAARKSVEGEHKREWFFWSLGAALFAHVAAFFGTSYWDQTQFAWSAFLAMLSVATAYEKERSPVPEEKAEMASANAHFEYLPPADFGLDRK